MVQQTYNKKPIDREYSVSVLIVDDMELSSDAAKHLCKNNFKSIESVDLNIDTAASIFDALDILRSKSYHVILLDRHLGEDDNGDIIDSLDYLLEIKAIQPLAEVVILTSNDDPLEIAQAMSSGASNYLLKDNSDESIAYKNKIISQSLSAAKLRLQRARDEKTTRYLDTEYICNSPAMIAMNMKLEALAESNRPVLLIGETGLGKGATARKISEYRANFLNSKTKRPFLNINFSSLNNETALSELFGHEPNSFTGAGPRVKLGFFELANGGDLFLDEIGDASLDIQKKILKVIEEREFQRVGGQKTLNTTARVIFATNRNLKEMVKEGSFRADLYARISTFEIILPTLEERKEDLPEIVKALIEKANRETSTRKIDPDIIPSDLWEYLTRTNVVGNIRGIENDIQRLKMFSKLSSNGGLDLSNWKMVLGVGPITLKRKVTESTTITVESIKSGNTDFLQDGFPGLKHMKELVEEACVREAFRKYPSQTERAKALKVHLSALSRFKDKYT
jgi:DNA-binding NtrC family response regulator